MSLDKDTTKAIMCYPLLHEDNVFSTSTIETKACIFSDPELSADPSTEVHNTWYGPSFRNLFDAQEYREYFQTIAIPRAHHQRRIMLYPADSGNDFLELQGLSTSATLIPNVIFEELDIYEQRQWRQSVFLSYPAKKIFSTNVEYQTANLPSWRPAITSSRRSVEAEDD